MDFKQGMSFREEKTLKRTALIRRLYRIPKKPTTVHLPHITVRTAPSRKKKAGLYQTLSQKASGVQYNRTLLELLKMCSPADVLKNLSLVNRHWMETCSSNEKSKELWNTFLEDLYVPPDSSVHPKTACAAYIRQQQTVVNLRIDRMDVLNKATGVWTSTMLSEPFQLDRCAYAMLIDGSLLCCGGMMCSDEEPNFYKRTYRVGLGGQVSALEPMITGRRWHGVVAYGRKVFVFGGCGLLEDVLTIEVYDESSWVELPAKLNEPHFCFVPCVCKGLIYLCPFGGQSVEVFNPRSLTIEILAKIKIPDWVSYAAACYEGSLVVIGYKNVWKWDIERKDSEVMRKPRFFRLGLTLRTVLHCNLLYVITEETRVMIKMKTFSRKYFQDSRYKTVAR